MDVYLFIAGGGNHGLGGRLEAEPYPHGGSVHIGTVVRPAVARQTTVKVPACEHPFAAR